MTLFALLLSISLGIGSLAWGFIQVGLPQFGQWIIIFGCIWVFTVWQRWQWFAYAGLTFNFLAAALGLWFLNFPPGWMFAGAIGGLLAWDLTYFRQRLRFSASDEEKAVLEKRHIVRISLLALLGFGLADIAMILKLQFNFEWALLSAVVAALGISQLINWFRKRDR